MTPPHPPILRGQPTRTTYRPLPNGLYIGWSTIDGQGLYTDQHLFAGSILGPARHEHIDQHGQRTATHRTPLGGFINHSDKPNCVITEPDEDGLCMLVTLTGIFPAEELTVTYRLAEYL